MDDSDPPHAPGRPSSVVGDGGRRRDVDDRRAVEDGRAVHEAALAELRDPGAPVDGVLAALSASLLRARPTWLRVPGAGAGDPPGIGSRRLGLLAAVAVAVVLAGAWTLLRRPPDPSTSLPRDASASAGTAHAQRGGEARQGSATTTVVATTTGTVVVHVAGAVLRPGVVSLPSGSRAVDAVDAAGGLIAGAEPDRVNLAAPLVDGSRLVVPMVGQPLPVEVAPGPASGTATGPPSAVGSTAATAGAPVDLNTADVAALDALPGVGPATAAAIIAHRDEHGPFTSVEDLLDVRGIGDAKLDALRDLVVVGP